MSFRLLTLSILVCMSVTSPALASGRTYVRAAEAVGRPHFVEYKEFGNRRRIAKLIDPNVIDTSNIREHVRDRMDRENVGLIPKAGNRLRIARLIDSSVVDTSNKVVIPAEPYGRERMILMTLYGNAKRLAKLVGPN